MNRLFSAALAFAFLIAVPASYGQMMDDMMKDHMGGGMSGSTAGKEADEQGKKGLTQEAEASGVTAKATYKNPDENKNPTFNVALDTHSVDLDRYRFEAVVVLRDDSGNVYKAELISSKGSGHHREASVEFRGADITNAKFVELVIKGVAGVDERVFRFEPSR